MSSTPVALDEIQVRYATFRDLAADARAAFASRLATTPADERVLIETCHRVELVAVGNLPDADLAGADAVRRVFAVVAGFDSAILAEEQVLGQVRTAYEAALAEGRTGPVLNELFRRALRFGRRVRSHARSGPDRSLADEGAARLLAHVPAGVPVMVLGTGEMGRTLATRLAAAGHPVTVVSRSEERGRALLAALPGAAHELVVGPPSAARVAAVGGIGLAVRSGSPAITPDTLRGARPWIVDLSMPSAVDPEARRLLGERLVTIDDLGGAERPSAFSPTVEQRLRAEAEAEVTSFVDWLEIRRAGDALAALHRQAEGVRRRHLDRLRARARLDDAQAAAVEAASAALLGELLHGPTVALRRGGADAATVRRLFALGDDR